MVKEGIILYDILPDDCLNGAYTNEHRTVGGVIFNEVARIKKKDTRDKNGISGTYDCFYFDYHNHRVNAVLEITNTGRTYYFEWLDMDGNRLFTGVGYKMNDRQLVAHYKE